MRLIGVRIEHVTSGQIHTWVSIGLLEQGSIGHSEERTLDFDDVLH